MIIRTQGIMAMNPRARSGMQKAVKETLRGVGLIYRKTAKKLTTDERHVVTGRYRRSIGNMRSNDGIFRFSKSGKSLDVGSHVPYAPYLEGRFSLLARSVDLSLPEIQLTLGVTFSKTVSANLR